MKYDFIYHNPTKIYFGKTALSYLKEALQDYGQKILLVYGGGSVKRIGLYDEVKRILKECDKQVVELSGVMPNPTYEIMMEGVRLIRQEKIDFILALGGGSVIDCAKGMSVAAYAEEEPWETYWINKKEVTHPVVPLGTVLTMVGTGSEANGGSVITHEEKKLKVGRVFGPNVYPKFSILNPEYTYSVPKYQMVSGIFDIMSHLMEQYFSGTDDNTSDYLIEGLLKSLIVSTKKSVGECDRLRGQKQFDVDGDVGLKYVGRMLEGTRLGSSYDRTSTRRLYRLRARNGTCSHLHSLLSPYLFVRFR